MNTNISLTFFNIKLSYRHFNKIAPSNLILTRVKWEPYNEKGFLFFVRQSSRVEEQLTAQLQGLRDQCNLKKSSLQDHVSSLEVLRDEVCIHISPVGKRLD